MTTIKATPQFSEQTKRLREEIEKKYGKTPEQLYEEREKRIRDSIALQQPDRVPVIMARNSGTHFTTRYTGVSLASAYYDPVAWKDAYKKTVLDFEPDAYVTQVAMNSGTVLSLLDTRQQRWPGGALPPDATNQFVEAEYMKENEYDLFLEDPTDFILRFYLPRVYGVMTPFAKLPPMTDRFNGFPGLTPAFATADFVQAAKTLYEAGQEQEKARKSVAGFDEEMVALGFPPSTHGGGAGGAPFDVISDYLRGMRGTMLDMYRCPDKVLAAAEKILRWQTTRAVPADPKKRGNPKITTSALHRGSTGFMSRQQFEKFYWPGLKKAAQVSIDLGYIYSPFCEGIWDDRLEYWLELPKGKLLLQFEQTDMIKAKAVLGDHACIMGNVPPGLLQIGSAQEVEDYCRKLIRICGKGGGFILANGSAMDTAKPANVKAMIDSVKKFSP